MYTLPPLGLLHPSGAAVAPDVDYVAPEADYVAPEADGEDYGAPAVKQEQEREQENEVIPLPPPIDVSGTIREVGDESRLTSGSKAEKVVFFGNFLDNKAGNL